MMIELQRNISTASGSQESGKIKLIGIGGAGSNVLDRVMLDGADTLELTVINTDAQTLTSSVVTEKVQLGKNVTRGLGAGGDPDVGMAAAEESVEEIQQILQDAKLVFLCVGLGGGTGSGAASAVAQLAREEGALVVAFAAMPFAFEGKRRCRQAEDALALLQETADVVICFENDRMGETVSPTAGIHQAFANADLTISQSIRAIASLLNGGGMIHIGFDDLKSAMRNHNARCLFGFGEADGDNRAQDALAKALKNPLMDRGRLLSDANHVLVNVAGGTNMTLNEVQILMEELTRHISDQTQVLFGSSVDAKLGNRMTVTLISSLGEPDAAHEVFANRDVKKTEAGREKPEAIPAAEPEEHFEAEPAFANSEPLSATADYESVGDAETSESQEIKAESEPIAASSESPISEIPDAENEESPARPDQQTKEPTESNQPREPKRFVPRFAKPEAGLSSQAASKPTSLPAATKPPQQATLQFEAATRGRFEKCEPTIVDGEDLDIPTYMRKNVRVK